MYIIPLERAVRELDPDLKSDSEEYEASLVLLASAFVGTSRKKLVGLTGVHHTKVAKFSRNLREGGVWQGRKVLANWGDPAEGGIAFGLDMCVALGWMKRAA